MINQWVGNDDGFWDVIDESYYELDLWEPVLPGEARMFWIITVLSVPVSLLFYAALVYWLTG